MLANLSKNKNGPILVLAALCSTAILSALFISAFLFLDLLEMDAELRGEMAQFRILADRSWEALFQEDWESGRAKRQASSSPSSSYFAPWKGGGNALGNCQCAPSARNCPKGEPGPPGEKGEAGVPGQSGPPGKPGASGGIFVFEQVKPPCVRCPQGEPGQKGRPGAVGRPGPDGTPGKNGEPGVNGQPGPRGEAGEHGGAGLAGNTGELGPPGESASTWAKKGTPGAKGSPGPAGPAGEQGPPGQNGQPGTNGLPGAVGPAGAAGEQGTPGVPGSPGNGGKEPAEKNYCPCPARSQPIAGPKNSYDRRGVRAGQVKLRSVVDRSQPKPRSGIA